MIKIQAATSGLIHLRDCMSLYTGIATNHTTSSTISKPSHVMAAEYLTPTTT